MKVLIFEIQRFNSENDTVITGTSENDNIYNTGSNVTIDAGDGRDYINNGFNGLFEDRLTKNVLINGGAGSDTIYNYGAYVTINAGDGNNQINSGRGTYDSEAEHLDRGSHVVIISGSGDDNISNSGVNNVTITSGAGNDYIYNTASYGTIDAGGGDDYISSRGSNVTINAGKGAATIENGYYYDSVQGNNVIITVGDENDSIRNYGSTVTIDAGGGDDYISSGGSNVTINAGDGNDTIDNSGSNVTIDAGGGDDYISSRGSNVTINAGDGNDTIYNSGSNVTINAGGGNDSIESYGSTVTIDAGGGDDYIYISSRGSNVTINAGGGNDTIFNYGSNVTINAGKGDDAISGTGYSSLPSFYKYNVGDGNDTISSFSENDTLMIVGASYTTTKGGEYNNQLIINVGEGSILFPNADYKTPIIQGTYGGSANTTSTDTDSNNTPTETVTKPTETNTTTYDTTNTKTSDTTTPEVDYDDDTTTVDNSTTITKYRDTYTYNGGKKTIKNYNSGEILRFDATYKGWSTDGNDLMIDAEEGLVRITEAQNKLIELADAKGNLTAHVYFASGYKGMIDGRGYGGAYEVIVGSDNVSNQIYADTAGSSLWGGRGSSNDDLYGNFGIDEYVYSYGNGQDNIFQSGNEDTVNLMNISLDQITTAQILDNGVNLKFTDGGALNISGQVGTFKLGGQSYQANYQNKSWSQK